MVCRSMGCGVLALIPALDVNSMHCPGRLQFVSEILHLRNRVGECVESNGFTSYVPVLQLLFTTVHLWSAKFDYSLKGLWSSLTNFTRDTSDLIVLSFLRVLSLSALAYWGSRLSWLEAEAKEKAKLKPKVRKEEHCNGNLPQNGKFRNGETNGELRQPLLGKKETKTTKLPTAYEEWFSGSSKKDVVLFVVFLICTAFQVIPLI